MTERMPERVETQQMDSDYREELEEEQEQEMMMVMKTKKGLKKEKKKQTLGTWELDDDLPSHPSFCCREEGIDNFQPHSHTVPG